MNDAVFSVSDFVAVLNQTLEYAYPSVTIVGELSNFKISKGKWIYFDLKDEQSSVRFFGTIYSLPGPLEDGMVVQVTGAPRMHQSFGFSVNVRSIRPVGEGSLKKAADLLRTKLTAEGLFAPERKRSLPFPPQRIGLVASGESAAYADFIKVLGARWGGVEIIHVETQVQGELAVPQLVSAIERLNATDNLDVIVVTRGGGSADDLAAFSTEQVVRAVAASRTPTLVAIGHEIDESLAELAADARASTPSNAAELLVPDRVAVSVQMQGDLRTIGAYISSVVESTRASAVRSLENVGSSVQQVIREQQQWLQRAELQLHGYDPRRILQRGYALIRKDTQPVLSIKDVEAGDSLTLRLSDGSLSADVKEVY